MRRILLIALAVAGLVVSVAYVRSRVREELGVLCGFENVAQLRRALKADAYRLPDFQQDSVSYFGLNPAVNASGEQERRQKRKGKGPDHLSRFGRSDIKHLCAEIGQSMIRRDDCPIEKWARHKLATGKEYNKVCMTAARKVVTYARYILNGVQSPNRDMQAFYERKLGVTYAEVGRETMTELGYPTRSSFVMAVSDDECAHLAEKSSELQT